MSDPMSDPCFESLTFGVETTIGYYDFSDEAVTKEKVGHQYDEAGREETASKWINGDTLRKRLPYLVCC